MDRIRKSEDAEKETIMGLATARSKGRREEANRRKTSALCGAMNVTKRKTAGEAYKPRPEDIPAPFTDDELKYIEAVERGCKRPKRISKPDAETEEEKQLKAYTILECNSFFFSK